MVVVKKCVPRAFVATGTSPAFAIVIRLNIESKCATTSKDKLAETLPLCCNVVDALHVSKKHILHLGGFTSCCNYHWRLFLSFHSDLRRSIGLCQPRGCLWHCAGCHLHYHRGLDAV